MHMSLTKHLFTAEVWYFQPGPYGACPNMLITEQSLGFSKNPPTSRDSTRVFCLRTPTQKGPDAEVVFAGKWDTKDAIRNKKRWVNSPYDFPHCLDPSLRKDHMSFSY